MKPENRGTRREGTVVTGTSALKFALFFTLCLALATLFLGWYLGYFSGS
jgi:hypothetical protein